MRVGVRFGEAYLTGNRMFDVSRLVFTMDNVPVFQKDNPPGEFNIAGKVSANRFLNFVTA